MTHKSAGVLRLVEHADYIDILSPSVAEMRPHWVDRDSLTALLASERNHSLGSAWEWSDKALNRRGIELRRK